MTRAFWISWRAGLITQWRACTEDAASPACTPDEVAKIAAALLKMIRVVEADGDLPAFDPESGPSRHRGRVPRRSSVGTRVDQGMDLPLVSFPPPR